MSSESQLPVYTKEEVATHNTPESLWLIVDGKVYDVTAFAPEHPGGKEILQDNAGTDASEAFAKVGHSSDAIQLRDSYLIGTVSKPECCCCTNGQLLTVGAVIVGVAAVAVGAYFAYKALKK